MNWQSYYDHLNPYETPYNWEESSEIHMQEEECEELMRRFEEQEEEISNSKILLRGIL